jgi:hypothetical protein
LNQILWEYGNIFWFDQNCLFIVNQLCTREPLLD